MSERRTCVATLVLAGVLSLLAPAAALAAGGSAASAAAGDPAASAVPAGAPAPEPSPSAAPALVIAATPATIAAGDRVWLVVRLGLPGAAVRLSGLRADAAEPTPLGSLTTDADGAATVRVMPRVTTTYTVDYAGDTQWLPASAEVTVQVRPRVAFAAPKRVYRGRGAKVTVAVRPLHPGAAVTVQRWTDGAWAEWKTLQLGPDSTARALWRSAADGPARLRAVMPADAAHAEGASMVRRIQVVRPNPYDVPLGARGIIVVDISQYTLRFYSHGELVRTFPCVTGRPGLPTPIGHFRIYARGVWPGGPYGARIMSYHPPCAIHGTNEPGLLSRFPRNFSHGCTRLYNSHAIWLYDHAPLGTPVWNVP